LVWEDREKAQQWAKKAEQEFRVKGRDLGEQFRRTGVVPHDFAGKILDLDLQDPAVKELPDEQFMLSWLSWYKYGKTWKQLQYERNAGKCEPRTHYGPEFGQRPLYFLPDWKDFLDVDYDLRMTNSLQNPATSVTKCT
jgi:hypothetical protein